MLTCLDCQVRWDELQLGRQCWSCGREISKLLPARTWAQFAFPAGDAARRHSEERGA